MEMSEEQYREMLHMLTTWTEDQFIDEMAGPIDPDEFITGIDREELREMGIQW